LGSICFLHKKTTQILSQFTSRYGKEVVAIPAGIMYNCTKALLARDLFCVKIARNGAPPVFIGKIIPHPGKRKGQAIP